MNNKGITLTALVITVMILLILTSVTVFTGKSSIDETKKTAFQTELKIAQNKVNTIYEKIQLGDTSYDNIGKDISNVEVQQQEKIKTALELSNLDGFKYFDQEELQKIGIDNVKQQMLINFNNRKVISVKGLKIGNTIIYTQEQLVDGTYNTEYENKNTIMPEFNLSKQIFGLTGKITVTDIQYFQNVGKGTIKYKLKDSLYWNECIGNTFETDVSGTYEVKVIDAANNETKKEIELILCNKPKLSDGMVPVVYNETNGKWEIIDENSGYWFDYGEKKWANVMLQDGLNIASDGKTIENEGSMFVWIPRYAYILGENYRSISDKSIDIKFLDKKSSSSTDASNIDIKNSIGAQNWNIPPAFTNNIEFGGWDQELEGIWVAKFEAGYVETTEKSIYKDTSQVYTSNIVDKYNTETKSGQWDSAFNYYGTVTSGVTKIKYPVFKPGKKSFSHISVSDIFNLCRSINEVGNIYGLNKAENDTHLMKNSEWATIAYLTKSRFGQETITANKTYETPNNVSLYTITGGTGYKEDVTQSTTGNIYGIYDMCGGSWEVQASYVAGSVAVEYGASLYDAELKYKNEYNADLTNETGIACYLKNTTKYGDAIYEISNIINNYINIWKNQYVEYPAADYCFFERGDCYIVGAQQTGIYAIFKTNGIGSYSNTFRPVIINI